MSRRVLLPVLLAAAMVACGDEDRRRKPRAVSIPSAGSVVRVDPRMDALVPKGARIEKIAEGFVFVEGPVWRWTDGPHLLFSDLRGNALYRWDPAGGLGTVAAPFYRGAPGRRRNVGPNGLTLDRRGRLVVCESGARRVSRFENGRRVVLAERFRGRRLNSPNDLVYRSDGSLYFTDPPYGLRGQDRAPEKELDFNGIFRLRVDGRLEVLDDRKSRPNGIAFSPDEKVLYVSNSDPARPVLFAYAVSADGGLGPARVFFDFSGRRGAGGPDGIKVDRLGNVYATGPGGVWVLSPDGRHLGTIAPDDAPSNLAWGGDGRVLYITAGSGLYRIALAVDGVRPDPRGAAERKGIRKATSENDQ